LNTLERFHRHKETAFNNHLNNGHTVLSNKVFDAIFRINPADKAPFLTGNPKHSRQRYKISASPATRHKRRESTAGVKPHISDK
jgi:hypothetical protein